MNRSGQSSMRGNSYLHIYTTAESRNRSKNERKDVDHMSWFEMQSDVRKNVLELIDPILNRVSKVSFKLLHKW